MNFFQQKDPTNLGAYLSLFKGLHELGGTKIGYDQAKLFLDGDESDQLKKEIACIVLLSKPAKVLFAGLTGKEHKNLVESEGMDDDDEKATGIDKNIEDLAKKIEITKKNLEKEEKSGSTRVNQIERLINKLEERLAELELEKEVNEDKEVEEDDDDEGEDDPEDTRESKVLDVTLVKYLPQLTTSDIANWSSEQKKASEKARKYWKDEFKNVNLTAAKRIALMSLELRSRKTSIHAKWIKLHGGRPTKAVPQAKEAKQTKDIFKENMREFAADKEYWNTREFKTLFNRWPTGNTLDSEDEA